MNKKQNPLDKKTLSEKDVKEYVMDRFIDVKNSNRIKNLVSFQAMNKYMIMSHDQNELKILGNIVASNKKIKFSKILEDYEEHLRKALEKKPTTKTHSNVLMHILGHFSKDFNNIERKQFLFMIKQFRDERIKIGEVLSEIEPIIYRFNNTYLASQTYFLLYANPLPGNLFQVLANNNS